MTVESTHVSFVDFFSLFLRHTHPFLTARLFLLRFLYTRRGINRGRSVLGRGICRDGQDDILKYLAFRLSLGWRGWRLARRKCRPRPLCDAARRIEICRAIVRFCLKPAWREVVEDTRRPRWKSRESRHGRRTFRGIESSRCERCARWYLGFWRL